MFWVVREEELAQHKSEVMAWFKKQVSNGCLAPLNIIKVMSGFCLKGLLIVGAIQTQGFRVVE